MGGLQQKEVEGIFFQILFNILIFSTSVQSTGGLHKGKQSFESESNTMELLSCYKLGSAARILHLSPQPDFVWK